MIFPSPFRILDWLERIFGQLRAIRHHLTDATRFLVFIEGEETMGSTMRVNQEEDLSIVAAKPDGTPVPIDPQPPTWHFDRTDLIDSLVAADGLSCHVKGKKTAASAGVTQIAISGKNLSGTEFTTVYTVETTVVPTEDASQFIVTASTPTDQP